jgi:OOP family OmpA-OmpF porin
MFSAYFGIRMGLTYVSITNASGSGSEIFENELYKIDFQGVINMGHMLNFNEFTSRLGLLAHLGPQISRLKIKEGDYAGKMDSDGGFIIGITPQFKITNRIVLNADFSYTGNFRQHLNWDGSEAADNKNLFGIMNDLTLGFTYYLGKNKEHADWTWNDLAVIKTQKMLDYETKIQDLQKDTDKDGIPDYLDLEKNTSAGSIVDSKGRTVVVDKNSTKNNESIVSDTSNLTQKEKDFRSIFENENNELFFDFKQVNPNKESKKKIIAIISYMKKYPESTAVLHGYTDSRGGEEFNNRLGLRRSEKVKEIMVLYGIDPSRISLISKGIDKLLSEDKNDLESLVLARRVVIVLQ